MKKLSFILIIIVSCLQIFAQDTTGNLLFNGGFEISKNGIMPDGWNGDNRVFSLGKQAETGMNSLKYSNDDPSIYKVCYQFVSLKPGITYKAGITVKTQNIVGNGYGASFCIQWNDKKGNWMGGVFPKGDKGTSSWAKINAIVTIPEDAGKVYFCCYVRKGMYGTAWFDNAFINPLSYNKLGVQLLSPNYRGLLFDGDSVITLSVKLENFNWDLSRNKIVTQLFDFSGNEVEKNITRVTKDISSYIIRVNAGNIPAGNYTLTTELIGDKNSNIDSWKTKILKLLAGTKPEVYIDKHQRLIINDKAIFPLGMYFSSVTESDLKIYADSKFNFLLPYNPPTEDQMKLIENYNLKVIYSLKDFYFGAKYAPGKIRTVSDEKTLIDSIINRFNNYPAVIGWYNNDEFSPEYIDRLNEHYSWISGLDKNHPVFSVIVNPNQAGLYISSTDIISSDPYAVPKFPLSEVGDFTKTMNQKLLNSRPVWMVIQAHDLGNYKEFVPHPDEYRSPTYDEMRCMSWQAICEGATGLIFYSFYDLKRNPDVSFDIQWSNLKKIVAEIDKVSDVLLSTDRPIGIEINTADSDNFWFDWMTKIYKNHIYIFVVNNGKKDGELKVKIPGGFSNAHLLNDQSKIFTSSNSEFTDSLKSMDLKIYVVEK